MGVLLRTFTVLHRPLAATRVSQQQKAAAAVITKTTTLFNRTITAMTTNKPNVVFVLGAPGSGKGTQCQNIVDEYGYVHLSAGDLLRAERKAPGSEYGELIEHHITNGTIVPVAITCSLLQRAMKDSGKSHFLIDGFPRNKDNLDGWMSEVGPDKANVRCVLFFHCEEKVCVERCLQRGAAKETLRHLPRGNHAHNRRVPRIGPRTRDR